MAPRWSRDLEIRSERIPRQCREVETSDFQEIVSAVTLRRVTPQEVVRDGVTGPSGSRPSLRRRLQNTEESLVHSVRSFMSASSNCAGASWQASCREPSWGKGPPHVEEVDGLAFQPERRTREARCDAVPSPVGDLEAHVHVHVVGGPHQEDPTAPAVRAGVESDPLEVVGSSEGVGDRAVRGASELVEVAVEVEASP